MAPGVPAGLSRAERGRLERDPLQPAIRRLAYANGWTRRLAVFCAVRLLYLLYAGAALDAWRRRRELTVADAVRSGLLLSLPVGTGKALHRALDRPRPFLRSGIPPLIAAEPRRGFPSDHTIQALALVAQAGVTRSGQVPLRRAGALLVALGRLGTNVHDSLDVLGGLGVAALYARLIRRLPLPERWAATPLLGHVPS